MIGQIAEHPEPVELLLGGLKLRGAGAAIAGTLVSDVVSGEQINKHDATEGKRLVVTMDVNPVPPVQEHLTE